MLIYIDIARRDIDVDVNIETSIHILRKIDNDMNIDIIINMEN